MKKLVLIIAALVMVAGTAYADPQWDFYGMARTTLQWDNIENPVGTNGGVDIDDYDPGLSSSRIGANVKVSDELSGRFEFGVAAAVTNRLIYGTWNFGAGSLRVGQDYTPIFGIQSNQVAFGDADMGGWGTMYSGRNAQVKVIIGDFQAALVGGGGTTALRLNNGTPLGAAAVAMTVEEATPQLELAYTINMDAFSLKLMGGLASYELVTPTATNVDVDSYIVGFTGSVNFGAAYVKGGAWMGQNTGEFGALDVDGSTEAGVAGVGGAGPGGDDGFAFMDATQTTVLDNDSQGMTLIVGFKASDMFTFEAGYGYAQEEVDTFAFDDEVSTYYVQSVITLAPGVSITPEIGVLDYEEISGGLEEVTYGAVRFQIVF